MAVTFEDLAQQYRVLALEFTARFQEGDRPGLSTTCSLRGTISGSEFSLSSFILYSDSAAQPSQSLYLNGSTGKGTLSFRSAGATLRLSLTAWRRIPVYGSAGGFRISEDFLGHRYDEVAVTLDAKLKLRPCDVTWRLSATEPLRLQHKTTGALLTATVSKGVACLFSALDGTRGASRNVIATLELPLHLVGIADHEGDKLTGLSFSDQLKAAKSVWTDQAKIELRKNNHTPLYQPNLRKSVSTTDIAQSILIAPPEVPVFFVNSNFLASGAGTEAVATNLAIILKDGIKNYNALAHELGHVLLGVDSPPNNPVSKPYWEPTPPSVLQPTNSPDVLNPSRLDSADVMKAQEGVALRLQRPFP